MAEGIDVAVIEYHYDDDYSNVYGNHRIDYYNIQAYPFPLIDGIIQPVWSSYASYASIIEQRKAIASNYSINFNLQGNGIDYEASVTVGQISANNVNKVLHVVLTESHIPETWYGGDEVNFVTRLMLPDQYGTPLLSKLNFDFEFTLEPGWVADNCQLAAFVQDTITKEIFQAQSFLLSDATLTYYDVALQEVILPTDDYCINEISPSIVIKNHSFENLESCLITYDINGESHDYNWLGEIEPDSSIQFNLPEVTFNLLDINSLTVDVSLPNGEEDENQENNMIIISFNRAQIIEQQQLILELMTDDYGSESSWEIFNSLGEIAFSGADYESNTLYSIDLDFSLDDCYEFIIYDEGGNGICCENGEGYYLLKDINNQILFEGGEFSSQKNMAFQIDVATMTSTLEAENEVLIYPNPVSVSDVNVIITGAKTATITIFNKAGLLVEQIKTSEKELIINTSGYEAGIYFLKVNNGNKVLIEKIVKM